MHDRVTNLNLMSSQTLAVSRTLRKAGRSWYLSTVDLIGNSISLMPGQSATMQTRWRTHLWISLFCNNLLLTNKPQTLTLNPFRETRRTRRTLNPKASTSHWKEKKNHWENYGDHLSQSLNYETNQGSVYESRVFHLPLCINPRKNSPGLQLRREHKPTQAIATFTNHPSASKPSL
jgi:hypothetical protein